MTLFVEPKIDTEADLINEIAGLTKELERAEARLAGRAREASAMRNEIARLEHKLQRADDKVKWAEVAKKEHKQYARGAGMALDTQSKMLWAAMVTLRNDSLDANERVRIALEALDGLQ